MSAHDNVLKTFRRLASEGGVLKTTPMENQYGGHLREWLSSEL